MGLGFTDTLTVDGSSGLKNLLTLLLAKGYQGDARLIFGGELQDLDAATDFYFYSTDDNANPPGVKQVETATVAGTVTGAGNATVILTAAGMSGSPITFNVPVTVGMTPAQTAAAINNALSSDVRVTSRFNIVTDPALATIVITRKVAAANDGTLNLDIDNGTCTGLTTAHTSANTTAGSLYTTQGEPIGPTLGASIVRILPKGTDLSTIWLYTASSISVGAVIQG
jgi:hypothetical protein